MGSTMVFLKHLREGNNITQLELAQKTGISSARISLAENGLGRLTGMEEEKLRDGIVAISKARTKRTVTESRTVELTESSSRLNSRASSKKYSDLTEAERHDRRKALLRAGGMTEKEAEIGAGLRGRAPRDIVRGIDGG